MCMKYLKVNARCFFERDMSWKAVHRKRHLKDTTPQKTLYYTQILFEV